MKTSIPSEIVQEIEVHLGSEIKNFSSASGGCINHGGRLSTTQDEYFLKWNDLEKFPKMFEAEARGLSLLRNANPLAVPEVIFAGNAGAFQFLLLEYIEGAPKGKDYWKNLGIGLATLHRNTSTLFGLSEDNYIGSLPQKNTRASSWIEFFIEQRLNFQLLLASKDNKIDSALLKRFDALFTKLPSLIPDEAPALLHGDLWGGNVMTTSSGNPCLIDPAVYYGHREADLAMTQLFGGFNHAFLESYDDVYPLSRGYEDRFDLFNLYPLLVHVNLFGGGYRSQVVSIIDRFV